MNKLPKRPRNDDLYKAILKLETFDECLHFFEDLCTRTELMAMEQRYGVAVCLDKGMQYRKQKAYKYRDSVACNRSVINKLRNERT